jgi:hypothetical protein
MIIVLAVTVIYLLSPYLINHIIRQQLSNLGFSSTIQSTRPNFNTIKFKSMTLSASQPPLAIAASLQDVSVSYHLYDLLFSQSINSINVATLDVNYKPFDASLEPTKDSSDLKLFTPNDLFNLLPVNNVNIKKITINYPAADSQLLQIKGNVSYSNQKIRSTLHYYENQQIKAELSLTINSDNSFNVDTALLNNSDIEPNTPAQSTLAQKISGNIVKENNTLILSILQNIDINKPKVSSYWLEHIDNKDINNYLEQLSSTTGQLSFRHKIAINNTFAANNLAANSVFSSNLVMHDSAGLVTTLSDSEPQFDAQTLTLNSDGKINWQDQVLTLSSAPSTRVDLAKLSVQGITNEKLTIILNHPFKLMFNSTTKHLSTQAFSFKLGANSWQSDYGVLKHTPIAVEIDQYDSTKHLPNIHYAIDNATFIAQPTPSKTQIAVSKLMANIKGSASLQDNKLAVVISDYTIDARDLSSADITAKKLVVSATNHPLNIAYSLLDSTLEVSDFSLALSSDQWQTAQGVITHKPLVFNFSDIDIAKQRATMTSDTISATITSEQLPFKSMHISSALQARFAEQQLTVNVSEKTQARLQQINAGFKTDHINLSLSSPIQARFKLIDNDLTKSLASAEIPPFSLVLTGSAIDYQSDKKAAAQAINYQQLTLSIKSLSLYPFILKASSKLQELSSTEFPGLSQFNIYADHQLNNKDYQAYARVINTTLPISLSFDINSYDYFTTNYAKWQLEPVDLAKHQHQIKQSIRSLLKKETARDVFIAKGEFKLNGKLTARHNKIEASVHHQLNDFTGTIALQPFENISYIGNLQFNNSQLQEQASLQVKSIGKAIVATDISAQLSISNLLANSAQLSIKQLKAKILDADVSLDTLTTSLYQPKGQATLYVQDLPLNNVLALEQQPTLVGTGTLNGKLPFRFENKQLWINNGQIKAGKKGYIRYQANDSVKAFAQTNAGLKIALDVLEDFHYSKLNIIIDYSPDGSLVLKNNLAGQNPSWQQGQPIDFSINIEENVLQLLKTLNFTNSLNDKISQKLNKTTE